MMIQKPFIYDMMMLPVTMMLKNTHKILFKRTYTRVTFIKNILHLGHQIIDSHSA